MKKLWRGAAALIFGTASPAFADDLLDLPLEQVLDMKVTSVSKSESNVAQSPSAVFVLKGEEIRRSGATNIADVLRLVPGLHVARIDSSRWSVSSRGFSSEYNNFLLVLLDGRVLYSAVYGGVTWDAQDTFLDDIDRIEVIRGPGATLWGANAVNGVINIITKKAQETTGGLFNAGGGTEEKIFGSVRYGKDLDDETSARMYAKSFQRDESRQENSTAASYDEWRNSQAGFRLDSIAKPGNDRVSYTLQGDVYTGQAEEERFVPTLDAPDFKQRTTKYGSFQGTNVLGRGTKKLSEQSTVTGQMFYDWAYRENTLFTGATQIFDLELQHQYSGFERQKIVYGAGQRFNYDELTGSGGFGGLTISPESRTLQTANAFFQDEIELSEKELFLTLGSKIENNSFTGTEVQPSIRARYTPDERNSSWAAVSRAVRVPFRAEENFRLGAFVFQEGPEQPPVAIFFTGARQTEPEVVIAYELGHRWQATETFYVDVAAFYNDYQHLDAVGPSGEPSFEFDPSPHVSVPVSFTRAAKGATHGVEVLFDWHPTKQWKLQTWYSYIDTNVTSSDPVFAQDAHDTETTTPTHQAFLRSLYNVSEQVQFDGNLRFVNDALNRQVPSYAELDLRVGYTPIPKLTFSVVGQNLLQSQHTEYISQELNVLPAREIQRGVYGMVGWKF